MKLAVLLFPTMVALAACAGGSKTLPPGQARPVHVFAECKGDSISIRVSPYRVGVPHGDIVEWDLTATDPSVAADSAAIRPANPGNWPFRVVPMVARPRTPGRSGAQKANAERGPHLYKLVLYCGSGRTVTIDPEVIIEDT